VASQSREGIDTYPLDEGKERRQLTRVTDGSLLECSLKEILKSGQVVALSHALAHLGGDVYERVDEVKGGCGLGQLVEERPYNVPKRQTGPELRTNTTRATRCTRKGKAECGESMHDRTQDG
jgi:hypothetical protein